MTSLDRVRHTWFEHACARIDERRIGQLITALTNIHSPTGAERDICQFLEKQLRGSGLNARCQTIQGESTNCIVRVSGKGDGPTLLLYSPIDTHLEADGVDDIPWIGSELRPDMLPRTVEVGDSLIGLGCSNPKAMVASIVEAVQCVVESGVPLKGDLVAAFCGGGMPWIASQRGNAGVGSGASYMLSHGITADAGVIVKTWDEIYLEHPGMFWFRITVAGSLGYSGIPRGTPEFRSSIVPAARLILELEEWLIEYPERHRTKEILPQGWIAAVHAGWAFKPAFPSAVTEIYLDIRGNPDQSPKEIEAELKVFLQSVMNRYPDIDAHIEMIVSIPGARVDEKHWIVRKAIHAWENAHGKTYQGPPPMSGISDASIIQRAGIPIVRIGYPFRSGNTLPEGLRDGLGGMGVIKPSDLIVTIEQLVHIIIDTCTRTRSELIYPTSN